MERGWRGASVAECRGTGALECWGNELTCCLLTSSILSARETLSSSDPDVVQLPDHPATLVHPKSTRPGTSTRVWYSDAVSTSVMTSVRRSAPPKATLVPLAPGTGISSTISPEGA